MPKEPAGSASNPEAPDTSPPSPKLGSKIELRGVARSFHEGDTERVVLQEVNATFDEGEFIVLLGRSGSGKSTLLNLIAGLEKPSRGSVSIDGQCITDMSEHECTLFRRHHVGFIFQSYNLIPTLMGPWPSIEFRPIVMTPSRQSTGIGISVLPCRARRRRGVFEAEPGVVLAADHSNPVRDLPPRSKPPVIPRRKVARPGRGGVPGRRPPATPAHRFS